MSKEKYSSNHAILIKSGKRYVFIGDIEVSDTLTVDNVIVTSELDCSAGTASFGDTTVDGYLHVRGDIGVDDLIADNVYREVPTIKYFNLPASSFNYVGNWENYASTFEQTIDTIGDGVVLAASESWKGSHALTALPNGCVIDHMFVRYTSASTSGFTVTGSILRRHKTTGVAEVITDGTITETSTALANTFAVAAKYNIDQIVDHEFYTYWAIINAVAGADTLEIHDLSIDAAVTNYD